MVTIFDIVVHKRFEFLGKFFCSKVANMVFEVLLYISESAYDGIQCDVY